MPNWCYTNISINNGEPNSLKAFYEKMQNWIKEGTEIKNDWDNAWLGLLVEKGLGANPRDRESYECRGCFEDLNINPEGTQITVNTETAWGPMLEMWVDLVDKHCPNDTELIWTAEECGCGLYATNDPMYRELWFIDSWEDNEIEPTYEATEQDVRDVAMEIFKKYGNATDRALLRKKTNTKKITDKALNSFFFKEDIDKVLDFVDDYLYDAGVAFNKWDFVEGIY